MNRFVADLLERSWKTFLQAFLATFAVAFTAPQNVLDVNAWRAAGVAALVASISAAISAVTSMLSKRVGDPDSASLVVAAPGPARPAAPAGVPLEVGQVVAIDTQGQTLTFD